MLSGESDPLNAIVVVHPGAGVPDRTLLNALLAHTPTLAAVPRGGIVHRLDKDTSGLLVVAKNVIAQADLVKRKGEEHESAHVRTEASQFEAAFVGLAHGASDLDEAERVARQAFERAR